MTRIRQTVFALLVAAGAAAPVIAVTTSAATAPTPAAISATHVVKAFDTWT
jgi:hypothetical protein